MIASDLQKAIFAWIHANEQRTRTHSVQRKHLIIRARAGSGKSTTAKECIRIVSNDYGLSAAYAMFTRDTVDDFKAKNVAERWVKNCNTAHGFGSAALRRKFKRVDLDKYKLPNLFDMIFLSGAAPEEKKQLTMLKPYVTRLTGMAKDAGIGLTMDNPIDGSYSYHAILSHHDLLSDLPKGVNQDAASNVVVEMSIKLLLESNTYTDRIDYPDMIYLALLYDCPFEKFDYVFVDEAQDTNPTRRMLYKRMLKPWGSLVIVGDSAQAIFGFSGADVHSMTEFRRELDADELPLSICYRCSEAVIMRAKKIVPEIEARPDAEFGSTGSITYDRFVNAIHEREICLTHEDVILCRFNAPNAALAFNLIRWGIPCRIEGRDIGADLIKLAERLNDGLPESTAGLSALRNNAISYMTAETQKHIAEGRSGKAKRVADRVECLMAVIDRALELRYGPQGVVALCRQMFQDSNDGTSRKDLLTLSSIHKAKGREWHRVFILGREDFMPSPWAKLDWEQEQEQNLIYVATTRAKVDLIEINDLPK